MLHRRMASDSKNPMVENAQQVPLRFWFLTEVIGFAFTVVNWYSGNLTGAFCADAAEQIAASAAAMINLFMMLIADY